MVHDTTTRCVHASPSANNFVGGWVRRRTVSLIVGICLTISMGGASLAVAPVTVQEQAHAAASVRQQALIMRNARRARLMGDHACNARTAAYRVAEDEALQARDERYAAKDEARHGDDACHQAEVECDTTDDIVGITADGEDDTPVDWIDEPAEDVSMDLWTVDGDYIHAEPPESGCALWEDDGGGWFVAHNTSSEGQAFNSLIPGSTISVNGVAYQADAIGVHSVDATNTEIRDIYGDDVTIMQSCVPGTNDQVRLVICHQI